MDLHALVADLATHWPVYVSMPFVAAVIGYVTKRVAIAMMFRPVEFVGIKGTPIGWQGVLPRNAARMATVAITLLTENLISMEEVVSRLDPDRLAAEIEPALMAVVDELATDVIAAEHPGLWQRLPDRAQHLVRERVRAQVPALVRRILEEIAVDVNSVLDVEDMAVTHLVHDKVLLNRLLRKIARPELNFIATCGLCFGFLLGGLQLVIWALTHSPLVMPFFGLGVGWFTDWLALKMVFLPREPRRFLGLVTWQGVFQKRRREVAVDYGTMIATEVLTTERITEALLRGPRADRLFALIQREIDRAIDAQVELVRPLVTLAVGNQRLRRFKLAASAKAIEALPDTLRLAEDYTTGALDVRNTIVHKMLRLSPLQFEGMLRPAFRQDEWKLIAVGALIGFLVGELQVLILLH